MSRSAPLALAALTAVAAVLTASPAQAHAPVAEGGPPPQRVHHAVTLHREPPKGSPRAVLARMSLPQKVGQLFMVGTPADEVDARTRGQIGRYHVGNVILTGRSYDGVRDPRRVSRTMQQQVTRRTTAGVDLLVAADQEGGQVQVLQGSGFDDMPTALVQGTWSPATLRAHARTWAGQLRRAGVNLDLAPVADTVPSRRAARHNPPIGRYDRELGFTPRRVASHAVALVRGLAAGGVGATVKHFPGLGRVHANTDTHAGVTDRVTTRHDAYLRPFARAVDAGAPAVMMSTAIYARLDPGRPAAFSPYVVGTMLRGDLGFDGVVVSDDLGGAAQVARVPMGQRATRFLAAGGDLVLTVHPETLPAMYGAVLTRARDHAAFRALVDGAALRILRAKDDRGLL
ncbi:glycoside hydrolase family 3 N-terminal domain-containing protein [Nocardioides mangrovi]|uniref:beta-N-acetylhexosaminidase n=1 Tax=Nocardioides mangrovi TaxID=2874580 RepID=A0ABS7UAZ6_9ACTN|nr:glycoside hydrolase family 3 N-terminal domain-containing protein [Nocardioides mangrovi]MBZ5737999.1 glycoside hydrolase family 3 [Nocardioides mangrovi]